MRYPNHSLTGEGSANFPFVGHASRMRDLGPIRHTEPRSIRGMFQDMQSNFCCI